MFLGTYTPKLDDKGRLTLPAKFRDELRGGLMITKGQDHCLYVFTRDAFAELARKVASAPLTSESARVFQRNLFSGTDEQNPDGQGRIAITPELRRYAGPHQGLRGDRRVHPRRDLGRAGLAALPGRARGRPTPRRRRRCCPASSEPATASGDGTNRRRPPGCRATRPTALAHLPRCQVRRRSRAARHPGGAPAAARRRCRAARSAQRRRLGRRGAGRWAVGQHPTTERRTGRLGPGTSPSLLPRVVELLAPGAGRPARPCLVDATLGLGGHAAALLAAHPQLTLVGLDRDPEALALAGRRLAAYADRTHLVHAVYDRIADVLAELGLAAGRRRAVRPRRVVAAARRGRARLLLRPRRRPRHADGPDAPGRPPPTCSTPTRCPSWPGCCASTARSGSPAGSPRRSPGAGRRRPLRRSAELVELLYAAVPAASRRTGGHPAKRTFQALRIEVNGELDALRPRAARRARRAGRRAAGSSCCPTTRWRTASSSASWPSAPASRTPVGLPVELPGHGPELRLLIARRRAARATTRSPTTRGPPRCGCAPPNGSREVAA